MAFPRKSMYATFVAIATMCLAINASAASPVCAGSASSVACTAGTKPVSEVPAGQVDGHNPSFTLSSDPVSGLPMRVFDNGIQEDEQTDFKIAGQSLTFLPTHVPGPGDVINVFYFAKASTGEPQPAQTSEQSLDERDVSTQLLRDAMNREMSQVSGASSLTETEPSPITERSAHRSQNSYGFSSLRMLERRLTAANSGEQRSLPTSKKTARRVNMTGVEGLGDMYTASPFDSLSPAQDSFTPVQDSELDQLLQTPSPVASRDATQAKASSVPSSIRMLVDRLRNSN